MDARQWQAQGAKAYRSGDLSGASEAIAKAAELDPTEPEYLRNLAELARDGGDAGAARRWLARAAEVTAAAPSVDRLNLLAASWLDLGERDQALASAAQAHALQENGVSRRLIVDAISTSADLAPQYRPLVARALREAWFDPVRLTRPAVGILRANWPDTLAGLAGDPLLAALLTAGAVRDAVLELRLTALRRALLLAPPPEPLWPLQARLAVQCFINEYAWGVAEDEQAIVEELIAAPRTAENLLRLAAYIPLGQLPDAEALLQQPWPPTLQAVLKQQITEPRQERDLAAAMPSLTAIRAGVSELVREMYEANPYPRWTTTGPPQPQPLDRVMRNQFPRAPIEPIPNAQAPEILIAGCGTGLHPIGTAGLYAGAKVLGVDLSRASLAYAQRKTAELGLQNVEYAHADVLELDGRQFDVIEAAGSLQCMDDPDEGARKLATLLRPGGLLKLGLYSRTARLGLEPARALGAQFPATPEGIRAFRQAILQSPPDSPLRYALGNADFYSTSMCRDLLLHVKEHLHAIPDIARMLADNGLRLIGFVLPPEAKAEYRRLHPEDPAATDLARWAALEQARPETFRLMYQFWAQNPRGA